MPTTDNTPAIRGKDWSVGDHALALENGLTCNIRKGQVYEVIGLVFPDIDNPDPRKRWRWKSPHPQEVGLILQGVRKPGPTGAVHHACCVKVTPAEEDAFDRQVIRNMKERVS